MNLKKGVVLTILSLVLATAIGRAGEELLGLRTVVEPKTTTFQLRLPGNVSHTPARIGPQLFVLDMAGITTQSKADSQTIQSPLVSSYRLLNYKGADDKPHVALEISLKENAQQEVVKVANGLEVRISADKSTIDPSLLYEPAAAKNSNSKPISIPQEKAPTSGTVSLREVTVVQPETGKGLEVEINGDGKMEYRTMELTNPARLVVDIPNAVNRIKQKLLEVNTPPLKMVRIAQFSQRPLVTRVVMDLDAKVAYEIQPNPNGFLVKLDNATAQKSSSLVGSPETILPVMEEPILMAAANQPSFGNPGMESSLTFPSPSQAVERAIEATQEITTSQPLKEAASETINSNAVPESEPISAPTELTVAPAESITSRQTYASQQASTVLIAQQTGTAMPSGFSQNPSSQMVQYTGEPISVNLKDVDLDDFFRLIHEISGLNIVVDPNVSGSVTIVLDEVPWDQALELVLRNNQLGKEVVGNVVRVARLTTLKTEEEQRRDLAKAVEEAQPRETVTRALSYARASTLVPTLKRFLSSRGDLIADDRSNMLIITDIPVTIQQLDGLIHTLDQKSQQVEIEARIVAASRSFARDIGTQLAASGASGNVVLGGAGIVGESPIARGAVPPMFVGTPPSNPGQFANVAQPLSTNFGAVGPTSALSFVLTGGSNFALDAIITAAERRGIGKLLSRPKIITQNNVEATVQQGVKIPIQTSVNNTISTQYINVTLRMTVTPQITAEGTIFLATNIENTTINDGIPRILGQPALNTQSAETKVLVTDGGTVFFGGVIQTDSSLNEQQVPLLGSIPLIGNLFKRKATSTSTNELLFFITPKITQS